jgi:hypothetical protein
MSAARPGDILRRKVDLAAPLLARATEAFWSNPRLPELFPGFLVAIHGSVRATVPLMEAAIRVVQQSCETDPIGALLAEYFPKHIVDERDHENWLLDDLEAVGLDRRSVLQRVPNRTIASMVGAQYYWIFHAHPVALLGFFAVLEGHPPTVDHLRTVQRRTGLPAEAFRMLTYHAQVDREHADDLYALLDRLPLSDRHTELVGVSALHTMAMLKTFFEGLVGADSHRG